MEKYICVHGHFYQPPRENPWLEAIELQDSAYPYHDWNDRVNAECYSPNGISRILDSEGYITQIVNNYSRISFNFGPTLLSWIEEKSPATYRSILEADKESQARFSGHGSALAQVYNHMILPLANERDKRTQVKWGVYDFERRFNRKPEGMWLPETAVNIPSLEALAEQGILFTILAPHQASRARKIGSKTWTDAKGSQIDPTMPYLVNLPSGRKIVVFFYDGPISRAVAFEHLLEKGEYLTGRLMNAFSGSRTWPQLVHIATDGETYGHHHRYGDMALAYALHSIEKNQLARLTNYGEFLEKFPPTHEAEIIENSSWSCVHGIERWKSDCGCNSGGRSNWTQAWRAPLRNAFDWLRDAINPDYEQVAKAYLKDPWEARDDYAALLHDRSLVRFHEFLGKHAHRILNEEEKTTVLKLLEIQRQAMLMYTSCGWFFDDISGIETIQIIQYAGRAIQLMDQVSGKNHEREFLSLLEKAPSNIPEVGNGRVVYEKYVMSSSMDLSKVAAHYAISSLFEAVDQDKTPYCYDVVYDNHKIFSAGKAKLAVGKMNVMSRVTRESARFVFGILYFGDHNLNGGVRFHDNEASYKKFVSDISQQFNRADFPETLRMIDVHFEDSKFSLKTLFKDEQRRILNSILESTLDDAEAIYRQMYQNHIAMMRFLSGFAIPLPKALQATAEFVLNMNLRQAFEQEDLDTDEINRYLAEAKVARVSLDAPGLTFTLRKTLRRLMERLVAKPDDIAFLKRLVEIIDFIAALPFEMDYWKTQNIYYEMLRMVYPLWKEKSDQNDPKAKEWIRQFLQLGQKLRVRLVDMKEDIRLLLAS